MADYEDGIEGQGLVSQTFAISTDEDVVRNDGLLLYVRSTVEISDILSALARVQAVDGSEVAGSIIGS